MSNPVHVYSPFRFILPLTNGKVVAVKLGGRV